MAAILFGSISTIADTSELQREAFNDAFREHGLDWTWETEEYRELLTGNGGKDRVAAYAQDRGEDVDAEAVHATKSERFREKLASAPLELRPGVAETVRGAKADGLKVGLVTTTAPDNVAALLSGASVALGDVELDLVVDVTQVKEPKPDRAAYDLAVERLGERADTCVAIEDNVGGVQAATAAGVPCVAFPNQNTAGHDFEGADHRVDAVDLADLRRLVAA